MDVSVIVTCWNGRELLEENLPFLVKASKNSDNRIREIIVVDDASIDDSVEFVNKFKVLTAVGGIPSEGGKSSKFKVIKHKKNLGYSAVCNTGVKEAREGLVVILNLDVIPSDDFLKPALPHFEDDKVFSVTFNEGKFGPGKLGWKNGFLEIEPTEISQSTCPTDWPNGGSSIFRKRIWEEIGGMDEIFLPFYFEDIDLGIRARNKGYKCLWEPKSKVEHKHEATINKENFKEEYINSIKQRNHLLLTWKNLENIELLFSHLANLLKRCCFHPKYLKIVCMAVKRRFFK